MTADQKTDCLHRGFFESRDNKTRNTSVNTYHCETLSTSSISISAMRPW